MFKKFVNSVMTSVFSYAMLLSAFEIFRSGNSLFFFGEPEYPSKE